MNLILNELAPFNPHRFNECMAFIGKNAGGSLRKYDLVKLHVLTDVFHVLSHGMPIIGGGLSAWKDGPVSPPAYELLDGWAQIVKNGGKQPEYFEVSTGEAPGSTRFTVKKAADLDDFSSDEVDSMTKAWDFLKKMSQDECETFFHGDSFIGKAWQRGKQNESTQISWDDIIEFASGSEITPDKAARVRREIRF